MEEYRITLDDRSMIVQVDEMDSNEEMQRKLREGYEQLALLIAVLGGVVSVRRECVMCVCGGRSA